jgi:3-methyladenine DNA glycosylase AlkD
VHDHHPPELDAAALATAVDAAGDPDDAAFLQRFFKTGPGEYGQGDVFAGVRVPAIRAIVKRFDRMPLADAVVLLESPVHEHRLAALLVMVRQAEVARRSRSRDDAARLALHRAYLTAVHVGRVNNWDLVDSTAVVLVGEMIRDGIADASVLDRLAASASLWERRVAVIATFADIRAGDAGPSLRLAVGLLDDREDLIHKAVGWMLREVGKRVDRDALTGFLDAHASRMPRTMLSYATEHLSPDQRAAYRAMR